MISRINILLSMGIFFALLGSAQASSKVVFMINMNYSTDELETLKRVAASRNQDLVVVPPEESNQYTVKFEAARTRMEAKIKAIHPDWDEIRRLESLLEIQRLGTAYNKDPEISDGAAAEMADFQRQFASVEANELKLGTIDEQIRKKLTELKKQGKSIDSLVISAHSDGTNLSGETGYNLDGSEVYQLSKDFPDMFKTPRHVLLMGCYTMTKSNRKFWRGSMFPGASLIAGFSPRAPSRTDPNNLKFMETVMAKANELDQKMASTGKPVTKEEVAKIFLALSAVSKTRYNPVIDYCTYQIEGKTELKPSCSDEWNLLLDQAQSVNEIYLNLENPQKNPPRDTTFSDLRHFYNDLQEVCPATELTDISKEEQNARIAYLDSMIPVIRNLIFWWDVQANFSFCNRTAIDYLNTDLANAGIDGSIPPLDGNTNWTDFVNSMNDIKNSIRYRTKALKEERIKNPSSSVNSQISALADLKAELSVMDPLYELNEQIPLSWHNSGTSPSRCGANQ